MELTVFPSMRYYVCGECEQDASVQKCRGEDEPEYELVRLRRVDLIVLPELTLPCLVSNHHHGKPAGRTTSGDSRHALG